MSKVLMYFFPVPLLLLSLITHAQVKEHYATGHYTDAQRAGVVADTSIDQSAKVAALLHANLHLYFPFGKTGRYRVDSMLLNGLHNVIIDGAPGVTIVSHRAKMVILQGSMYNITIQGLHFSCTKVDTADRGQGLLFLYLTGKDVMDNINITENYITGSRVKANGISIVLGGGTCMIKNAHFDRNHFLHYGRFGIEMINHVAPLNVPRYFDCTFNGNFFNDGGTVQAGISVSAISNSGYGYRSEVNYNTFGTMRMQRPSVTLYGIENAGCIDMQTIGNTFTADAASTGYTAITGTGPGSTSIAAGQPIKSGWLIKNNHIAIAGTPPGQYQLTGMDLENMRNCTVEGNTIQTVGYSIITRNVSGSSIIHNITRTENGTSLYIDSASVRNCINGNILEALGPPTGVIQFSNSATHDNIVDGNELWRDTSHTIHGDMLENRGAVYNIKQRVIKK